MVAGFWVRNDYDTVQIDDTYSNLYLKDTGTRTLAVGVTAITITGGNNPIMAFRGTAIVATPYRTVSGSDWIFNVPCIQAGSFNFYVFDSVASSVPDHGLIIRDASNQVVFHSSMKPMKIVDFVAETYAYNTSGVLGTPKNHTYASGEIYAVIGAFSEQKIFEVPGGGGAPGRGYIQQPVYQSITDGFSCRWGAFQAYLTTGSLPPANVNGQTLVLDVTGY